MTRRLLTLGSALLAATCLMAQPGSGGTRTPPTAEQMLERRIQHLTTFLELNTTQQAQAKTIFTDEATALQALQTRQTEARTALQNAIQNTGLDADIERAATQVGALHTQVLTIQGKAQAKFRAILTAQQKEKLDAMRGAGMGGGPGMGGPNGPRGGGRF